MYLSTLILLGTRTKIKPRSHHSIPRATASKPASTLPTRVRQATNNLQHLTQSTLATSATTGLTTSRTPTSNGSILMAIITMGSIQISRPTSSKLVFLSRKTTCLTLNSVLGKLLNRRMSHSYTHSNSILRFKIRGLNRHLLKSSSQTTPVNLQSQLSRIHLLNQ